MDPFIMGGEGELENHESSYFESNINDWLQIYSKVSHYDLTPTDFKPKCTYLLV